MAQKKITVKHYLNKRAKAKSLNKEKHFPLYIQIIVNGKKAQIKSKINEHLKIYRSDIERITKNNKDLYELLMQGYFSDKLFDDILRVKLFPLHHLLMDEVAVITRIIEYNQPFTNKEFTLNNFSEDYTKYTEEISQKLDSKIKTWYLKELKDVFLKTIDQDENRDVFKITNYLIHYINWENAFSNFYESTFEIIPTEFKTIENFLSNELRVAIKAYLAFHSKVNILKRFFEKRELGKISTLSYLDWETNIRKFVENEFELLFGEQKALQYVLSLDAILTSDLNIPVVKEEA
jgi:predicted NAD-dependent protein-ADP-ribosyltransferase YbiA (DUF1768 family)